MTMEDVLFSVKRYEDPDLASYLMWMYDSVDSIEQTGDWQFTVKLKQPDALWKHTFATTAGMIHSKAYVEAHPDDYGTATGGVLGTGPYVVDSWDVGNQVSMSYNENWWNKEVDMLGDLEKADDVDLLKIPSMGLEFLSFNCKKAPFDDVNVRKAIAYAIDDVNLQDNVIKDFGTLTNGLPVPESLFLFEEDTWKNYEENCEKYSYDLEKAQECLAASAYPNGFECTITVDQKFITNSIALVLQQELSVLGIQATIEKVSNDEVDELLSQQASSTDDAERTDLMLKALDIITDEVPNYVWTHQNWLFGINKRVTSGVSQLTGSWFWNFYVKNITLA